MKIKAILLLFLPLIISAAAPPATVPATSPATNPASTAAAPHSVWDAVYSKDQLTRGQKAYNTSCTRCHGESLLGNDDAPPLVGADFLAKWNGKSVGRLVDLTQKTMPSDGPGKISRKTCTDMVAFLLNANGFPAGNNELVPDADVLNAILIQAKK